METRRNILAALGLSPIAAVAVEQFNGLAENTFGKDKPVAPGLMMRSLETQEKIASALDNLAAAIRRHDVVARAIDVHSTANFDEWMAHEVKVTLEIPIV